MKLDLTFAMRNQDEFIVELNNQKKKLTYYDKAVEFEFEKEDTYCLHIYQERKCEKNKFVMFLLYSITWLLRGVCCMCLDLVHWDWISKSSPYYIDACIPLELTKDSKLHIHYKKAEYEEAKREWKVPELVCEQEQEMSVQYTTRGQELKDSYFHCLRNALSAGTILTLLFSGISYACIQSRNLPMLVFSLALLAGATALLVKKSYGEYKRLLEVQSDLENI